MKKDTFSLIQNQQQMMGSMHKDFMSLISEYMGSSGDVDDFSDEVDVPGKKEAKFSLDEEESMEMEGEGDDPLGYLLTNELDEFSMNENDGVEFNELGMPIIKSYSPEDIDLDDPAFASGKYMGLPILVSADYSTRGRVNRLLPIRSLFEEI